VILVAKQGTLKNLHFDVAGGASVEANNKAVMMETGIQVPLVPTALYPQLSTRDGSLPNNSAVPHGLFSLVVMFKESDLLLTEWRNSVCRPCHFLAADKKRRRLVLSIRLPKGNPP
jgi:hypothetical protein